MQSNAEESVIFGSFDPDILNKRKLLLNKGEDKGKKTNEENIPPQGKEEPTDNLKISSSTCRPVAKERPRIELPRDKIEKRIEYMRDHAIIGKFIGFWPTERALHGWIEAKWKPKGDVTLQLGPKGFFTVIFFYLEDKYRVIGEGPYFFNSAGLYIKEWTPKFIPDKEDLTWAPVWIRIYSLPDEYWDEDILKDIGNGIGEFIKAADETKSRKYTSYARICVFIRLNEALPEAVTLVHRDEEWIQTLDYEHVPFHCRKCHALGHLFRDCPLNVKASPPESSESPNQDGFTKVPNRRRSHKKPQHANKAQATKPHGPVTKNSFEFLAQTSEEQPIIVDSNPDRPSSSSSLPSQPILSPT